MAELAVNIETGNIHAVTEIALDPELIRARWRCMSCELEVFPAAHLGDDYDVAPYFRANQPHRDCPQDDFGAAGYGRGRNNVGIPDRLILRPAGPQAPVERAAIDDNDLEVDGRNERRNANNDQGPRTVVGSLHPLALVHQRQLNVDDRRIRILDWPDSIFRYSFKSLKGRVDPLQLAEQRIFYSDIMFMNPVETDRSISATLQATSLLGGQVLVSTQN